jgi:hypothetical protein
MKWAIAAMTLVVAATAVVLTSAWRERAAPATLTSIDVCAGHLIGGGASDQPPALRLVLAADSLSTPPGLDAAGLRALGFAEAAVAAVGQQRDSTFRWPRTRPAWVRLRQRADSLEQLDVVEVAPRREQLARDSGSIVIRGLVGFRERRSGPPPDAVAGHDHGRMGRRPPGVMYAAVIEPIPWQLHLDRDQVAALRATLADSAGCRSKKRAVIANGARGGLWITEVR